VFKPIAVKISTGYYYFVIDVGLKPYAMDNTSLISNKGTDCKSASARLKLIAAKKQINSIERLKYRFFMTPNDPKNINLNPYIPPFQKNSTHAEVQIGVINSY